MNDNLNNLEDSCNRLVRIADEQRKNMIITNAYSYLDSSKYYGANHPNATTQKGGTDDPLNIKGKGTGEYLDFTNGGGYYDIYGRPDVMDSGRLRLISKNKFSADKPYNCFIEE